MSENLEFILDLPWTYGHSDIKKASGY